MSFEVCKARVYGFKNEKGRRIPDYIIKNNYRLVSQAMSPFLYYF